MQSVEGPQREHSEEYYEMNAERQEHLRCLITAFRGQIDGQHEHGQKEHGGDLWKKACFPRLKPELIDAFTYAFEHEQRMMKWLRYLDKALSHTVGMSQDGIFLVEKVREEIRLELSCESAEEVFNE